MLPYRLLVWWVMLPFLFNGNLITVLISLELILLSLAILLAHLSFQLDDLIGSYLSLLILPLAGAESALALALLVSFFPSRSTILIS